MTEKSNSGFNFKKSPTSMPFSVMVKPAKDVERKTESSTTLPLLLLLLSPFQRYVFSL